MTIYYQDEHVTLHHGDALEIDAWLTADVLVTDPPYGVAFEQRLGDVTYGARRVRTRNIVKNDNTSALRDTALSMWETKPAIVFGSWRITRPPNVNNMLIWHKEGAYTGPAHGPFFTNHEEIYVIGKGWQRVGLPLRSVITTTEHRSVAAAAAQHPTPKPVALMELLIERAPPGVIADPFAGSGSTLLAARNLGRQSIGIEIDERYCELIANHLSQTALDLNHV